MVGKPSSADFVMKNFTVVLLSLAAGVAVAEEEVRFNRDIRPIFSDTCFACHGFDAAHRKAELRMDLPESAFAVRTNGLPAITPGNPAKSEAWLRLVTKDPKKLMPPEDSHKVISDAQKATIKKWIEQGAKYEKHWAFEAPVKSEVPKVAGVTHNPIDNFLAARLAKDGLKLSDEASKETLVRRVAFATTGLPPTTKQVDEFLSDKSEDAYGKMVDRFLASPHYGEEMARHWLDVARYGDTHGLHLDNERQMWVYRDWVVRSFNANQRFDQFTIDQLAGDLIPNATKEQLVATGFNRCNVTTSEGGAIAEEFIYRYAVDRAVTMAETWMGLTAGCATCHDHKFDPFSTKEFYQLYAFFHSNADPAMDGNALLTQPVMKMSTPDQDAKFSELDGKIAEQQKVVDAKVAEMKYTDPATLEPKPAAADFEEIWLDDSFPKGASLGSNDGRAPIFATAEQGAPVLSGKAALKRDGAGLQQNFYNTGAEPLEIPENARLVASVYLDPQNPPKAVMLQYHKGAWNRRAIWGDAAAIPYGKDGTIEKINMGPLPAVGKWVKLEVPASKLDLKAGETIEGFAVTTFGGVSFWDRVGVAGRSDPANDPRHSMLAWIKDTRGKDLKSLPDDVERIVKAGQGKKLGSDQEKIVLAYYLQNLCVTTKDKIAPMLGEVNALKQQRAELDKQVPSTFIFKDLDKPRDSFVMIRGQYDKKGEKVAPGTPAILPPLKSADTNARLNRLDLAKWLMSAEHPLTARVTVNRFWQQFFGVGLVKTTTDFGSQGEPPVHPELLDWLSIHFRETGWDVKALVKTFLTSAAFRQSSRVTRELWERDPENRLLARGPRFRLDAEQVRDNVLHISGLLDPKMGGRGVNTYQPPNLWEPIGYIDSNTRNYKQGTGSDLYRRSLYTFLKRTAPPPFMGNFDAPSREQSCARRDRSNTPMQALQTMNDVQHFEAARVFAERMLTEGGATPDERITFAYRTILARKPATEELALIKDQLAAHQAEYAKDIEAAKKAIAAGESKPKLADQPAELAAYTMVANTILNLDETLNRN